MPSGLDYVYACIRGHTVLECFSNEFALIFGGIPMQNNQRRRIPVIVPILLCVILAAGSWFWYDTHTDRSGWKQAENGTLYLDFYGDPVSGWQEIDGQLYYFGDDNLMTTHWLELEGKQYYFGDDGALATGWQEIDGKTYCFSDSGNIRTGWVERNGRRCYLGADGTPRTGWLEDGYATCYLDEEGFPLVGDAVLDGKTYRFQENGHMYTGWLDEGGQFRYYHTDGSMATGFTTLDEGVCYFSQDGIQQFGWIQEGEYSYYFLPDGTMATGPRVIDGKKHYFGPQGEHIVLVNPWNPLPEYAQVTLADIGNQHSVDQSCAAALNRMLDACREAGYFPYVCSSYRTQEYQQKLFDKKIATLRKKEKLSRKEATAKAKTSVAVPGTSEHQLGLAVDIVADGYVVLDYTQAKTDTQKWLMEHCWEYGFILRYPEGSTAITGIIFEPWHYRYVGEKISMEMKELGITLEEYLGAAPTE